jgi:hypothetical protein
MSISNNQIVQGCNLYKANPEAGTIEAMSVQCSATKARIAAVEKARSKVEAIVYQTQSKAAARVAAAEQARAKAKDRASTAGKAKVDARARVEAIEQANTRIQTSIEVAKAEESIAVSVQGNHHKHGDLNVVSNIAQAIDLVFALINSEAIVELASAEIEAEEAAIWQANVEIEILEAAAEKVREEAEVKAATEEQILNAEKEAQAAAYQAKLEIEARGYYQARNFILPLVLAVAALAGGMTFLYNKLRERDKIIEEFTKQKAPNADNGMINAVSSAQPKDIVSKWLAKSLAELKEENNGDKLTNIGRGEMKTMKQATVVIQDLLSMHSKVDMILAGISKQILQQPIEAQTSAQASKGNLASSFASMASLASDNTVDELLPPYSQGAVSDLDVVGVKTTPLVDDGVPTT